MVGNGLSADRILKEIEKCVVVCSNCHKKIHWNQKCSISPMAEAAVSKTVHVLVRI